MPIDPQPPPPLEPRDSPRILVPPPLIVLATLAAGLALDGCLSALADPLSLVALAGFALSAAGVALIAAALRLFRKSGTRAEPWQPSSQLVGAGIYRVTRNPMYLGMLLFYAGPAIAFRSPTAALLLVPLGALFHFVIVAREEAYLTRRFGDGYASYKSRVRRWF